MKKLYNFLSSEYFTVHKHTDKKIFAVRYDKDFNFVFAVNVEKKQGLYYMNFSDFREKPEGELDFVVTPYISDIIEHIKSVKTKRFRELVKQNQK